MIAHKWEHISQLPADNPYDFSEINTFQRQWLEYRQTQEASSPDVFRDFHERVTRSWAIETGIIEGLYTLEAGMTQTLVTHGISADRIERGTTNKDPEDLALVLTDHQEAVNGVYQSIRQGLPISRTAIRQLHQVLTKHQLTYKVVDQFGREFETELHHGAFKTQPNSPTRKAGRKLERFRRGVILRAIKASGAGQCWGSVRTQKGLWEADRLYLDYVGKDTFYGLLASLRGQLFSDDDFAEIYCPDNGRDSVAAPGLLGHGAAVADLRQGERRRGQGEG